MSDILPVETDLGDIKEAVDLDIQFTADLTEPGAYLKSLKITAFTPNSGVVVDQDTATITGFYKDSFNLSGDAFKYRLRNGVYGVTNQWDNLPPPQTADLYEFTPPSVMQETYSYTVELVYGVPPPEGSTGTDEEYTITKTYTQTVFGEWSKWADLLRAYVAASSPGEPYE